MWKMVKKGDFGERGCLEGLARNCVDVDWKEGGKWVVKKCGNKKM